MRPISVLAIVSIIAILLAIGLIYFIAKPPKMITTTSYIPTISYIPTTYTETAYILTTYYFTTTYTFTTTYQTPPTTITKTITEIITYTYVPEEKIELVDSVFYNWRSTEKICPIYVDFKIVNKEYSSIYIDPNRPVIVKGRGLLKDYPDYSNTFMTHWYMDTTTRSKPFILAGSPYNPPITGFVGTFTYPNYFNPKEIKKGQVYTVSFDYKVIYINGTMSDWKTFTFNVTYTGIEQDP